LATKLATTRPSPQTDPADESIPSLTTPSLHSPLRPPLSIHASKIWYV